MPLWGRNDQAVTANSTTTRETSNGAPIGTYTAVELGGGANAHFGNTSAGSRAATDVAMFNNATPGAFISGMAVGVFGVSAPEMANNVLNNSVERGAHAGWNLRRAGTGPVTSFTVTAAGSGFSNGETIRVSNGGTNATGTAKSAHASKLNLRPWFRLNPIFISLEDNHPRKMPKPHDAR